MRSRSGQTNHASVWAATGQFGPGGPAAPLAREPTVSTGLGAARTWLEDDHVLDRAWREAELVERLLHRQEPAHVRDPPFAEGERADQPLLHVTRSSRRETAPEQADDERVPGLDDRLRDQLVSLEDADQLGEPAHDVVDAFDEALGFEPQATAIGGHIVRVEV